MPDVRQLMRPRTDHLHTDQSVLAAARQMRDLRCASLPVCGEDHRLRTVLTAWDVVVHCVAAGTDPARTPVQGLVGTGPWYLDADADLAHAVQRLRRWRVRRLPVVDGRAMVGTLSQGDLARDCPPELVPALLGLVAADLR